MNNIRNTLLPSTVIPSFHQTPALTTNNETIEFLNNLNNSDNQFNCVTNESQYLPLTSMGIITDNSENIYPDNNIGEDLECDNINTLYENIQSLPMTLQQRTIERTEEFIDKRDKIQKKPTSLNNLQYSIVPPKLAFL